MAKPERSLAMRSNESTIVTASVSAAAERSSVTAAAGSKDDPVFAAIEKHRSAGQACDDFPESQELPPKLRRDLVAAQRSLVRTVPVTREGLLALLEYVQQAKDERFAGAIRLQEAFDAIDNLLSSVASSCRSLLADEAHSMDVRLELDKPLSDARALSYALWIAWNKASHDARVDASTYDALERLILTIHSNLDTAVEIAAS
jgi:hypothetical protein